MLNRGIMLNLNGIMIDLADIFVKGTLGSAALLGLFLLGRLFLSWFRGEKISGWGWRFGVGLVVSLLGFLSFLEGGLLIMWVGIAIWVSAIRVLLAGPRVRSEIKWDPDAWPPSPSSDLPSEASSDNSDEK